MKKFHISVSTENFSASLNDYTQRLGCAPSVVAEGRYALWRTEILNFSLSCKPDQKGGLIRHIGFGDSDVSSFTESTDVNGITWELFNQLSQEKEITEKIPGAKGVVNDL